MEFFEYLTPIDIDASGLRKILTIENSINLCASITQVIEDKQTTGTIYCIWGEFRVNREVLDQGVRFSMPSCPNAIAWTLTINHNKILTIHCTINQQDHDQDFIESIEGFVSDWKAGLVRFLAT